MGLLDPKVFDNPWFQLGSSIIGNNQGYYGAFGPAFGAGMQDFQRQRALSQENARRNAELEMQRKQHELIQAFQQNPNQQTATAAFPQLSAKQYFQKPDLPSGMRMGKEGPEWIPGYLEGKGRVASAGAPKVENIINPATPAQKKFDEKTAENLAEFEAAGGYADALKNIRQLRDVKDKLSKSDNLTGWAVGSVPDFLAPMVTPEAVDAKQLVEEVVQRNLRTILGAQFTQKEGERLIERAYNPKLDESVNKKRLESLITAMEEAYKQKQSAATYIKRHGSLVGWKGQMPSLADFYDAIGESGEDNTIDWNDL